MNNVVEQPGGGLHFDRQLELTPPSQVVAMYSDNWAIGNFDDYGGW